MAKAGKTYRANKAKVDAMKQYNLTDAVALVKEVAYGKFDGSVELAIKTNANPKYNDQIIRATVVLPNGTGKKTTVAAFVSDDKADEAKKAGADIIGKDAILDMIKAGNLDFDVIVTEPSMMRDLASVAKILGPKGLMPSPKAGTVTPNISKSIEEIKKGRIEFKLDKTGNIHGIVGKISFANEKLIENIEAFLQAIDSNKPVGVKGKLYKKIVIAPTMGPGVSCELPE